MAVPGLDQNARTWWASDHALRAVMCPVFRSHQGLLFVAVGIAELRPLSVFRQWRSLRFSLDLTPEEERGPGLSAMPD